MHILLTSYITFVVITNIQTIFLNRFQTQKGSQRIIYKDPVEFNKRLEMHLEQSQRLIEMSIKKEKEQNEEKQRRAIFKKYLEFIASGTSVLKDFYSPLLY